MSKVYMQAQLCFFSQGCEQPQVCSNKTIQHVMVSHEWRSTVLQWLDEHCGSSSGVHRIVNHSN